VERRRLGTTDLEVSVFGLGCGGFGGVGSVPELFGKGEDETEAFAIMDRAVELDIDYFDTANSYGGGASEEMIGRWLRSRRARHRIVLSTKVLNRMGPGRDDAGLSRAAIAKQIDQSLGRLQTDHVDLYVTHGPDPSIPIEETLGALDDVVRAGKARHAGCSNVSGEQLRSGLVAARQLGVPGYRSVQNSYSLLDREAEAEVLPLALEAGLGVTPFSPLAGGWLTGKYRAGQAPPRGSRMTLRPEPYEALENERTYRRLDALRRYADRRGVGMAALALAWVVSHKAVTVALVGPRSLEQYAPVEQALGIRFDESERDSIVAAMDDV
jgi:aryl-alcohol dehydrogenase-like predicted oxidoreductase